jgi:TPR repeat protein
MKDDASFSWKLDLGDALRSVARGLTYAFVFAFFSAPAQSQAIATAGQCYAEFRDWHGRINGRAYRACSSAARSGSAEAQSMLGTLYANGEGVPQNLRQAYRWKRMAAEQGYVIAQTYLASMYYSGTGAVQNYNEAARWFRMAAEQGEMTAQYRLAIMFSRGFGVAQDYTESARWFRLAAVQGHPAAPYELGWQYVRGQGVAEDRIKALMWWHIATANSERVEDAVTSYHNLWLTLTRAQTDEAERRSRACMDNQYRDVLNAWCGED